MNRYFAYFLLIVVSVSACTKSGTSHDSILLPADSLNLTYGDSVFYVKEGDDDNIILPKGNLKGRFSGFPEGIEIDELTGAINADKSETGLRYRISFIPDNSPKDTLSTIILLSGISYLDKIYYLDKNQYVAHPLYDGRTENLLPGTNGESVFDEGGGCNGEGVAVNIHDGSIDLAKTIANGVFGDQPANGAQKEVELRYRISDKSNKALNRLKVKLYYFETADDITQDLVAEMNERRDQNMFIGVNPQPPFLEVYNPRQTGLLVANNGTLGAAKPRPPCIFLVGRASAN
jgi:hypothetical protein